MFYLRVSSIGIHRKRKSNHYLVLLVIFHDLEMTQVLSVNYFCLVYKLKFLFWTYPKFWAIFKTDLKPLYLELYFLLLFGDCGSLFFDKKFSKILYLCFLFIQNTAELVPEKLPILRI